MLWLIDKCYIILFSSTDDSKYQMVFAALDELTLASLKPFFQGHCLEVWVYFDLIQLQST